MSHFKLFVVGDDVEALLEPFDENDRSQFIDQTDSIVSEWEQYKKDQLDDGEPIKYDTLESYAEEYCGYELVEGRYGYYSNPNAKWDWWEVGGRYSDYLLSKRGVECDTLKVKDVDFEAMATRNAANAAKWWKEAQNEQQEIVRSFMYGITKGMTEEEYIASHTNVSAFAFLMGDQWVERGEMGWFGVVTDEKESTDWETQMTNFIKNLDPEQTLTVVDCHI
jgi:hypothetical protein